MCIRKTILYQKSTGNKWLVDILQRWIMKLRYKDDVVDIRSFFNSAFQTPKEVQESFSPEGALYWVWQNIDLVSDVGERWQMPQETLQQMAGDCEDGAILLANIFVAAGSDPAKVLISVASTPSGYHCYVTYESKLFDWTRPHMREVPSDWVLAYCFSKNNIKLGKVKTC